MIKTWYRQTEVVYPEDDEIRMISKEYLSKPFDKITKMLEEEMKVKAEPTCDLYTVGKPEDRTPKSVPFLILKAIDFLTK